MCVCVCGSEGVFPDNDQQKPTLLLHSRHLKDGQWVSEKNGCGWVMVSSGREQEVDAPINERGRVHGHQKIDPSRAHFHQPS